MLYDSQSPLTEAARAALGDNWGQTLTQYERTQAKHLGSQMSLSSLCSARSLGNVRVLCKDAQLVTKRITNG